MTHDIPLILATACYVVAAALLYQSVRKQSDNWRNLSLALAIAGVVFHAGAQVSHWLGQDVPDVSLPHLMSLCALVILAWWLCR
jgi:ABC-type uncharacterized transport system permease subunit